MAKLASMASHARRLQVTGWLLLALITGALTLAVWIASAVKPATAINKKVVPANTVIDPLTKLTNHTTTPSELNTAVKPLTYDTVVHDMRNYPPQFKDSRFLKANTGKWTIQVMNVAEHEVVTDYLNKREDKDKFNYFRITDEQNQKRYVVTYGLYGSAQEAMIDSKSVNFGLPANVSTFPEEIRLYLGEIDEYEVSAPIQNLGTKTPKEVKLRTAPKPIPAPKAKTRSQASQEDTSDDDDSSDTDISDDENDDSTIATPAAPTRSIEKSSNRNETLVIQEKPVPAFVEKPHPQESHPVTAKPAQPAPQEPKPRPVPIKVVKPSTVNAAQQDDGE